MEKYIEIERLSCNEFIIRLVLGQSVMYNRARHTRVNAIKKAQRWSEATGFPVKEEVINNEK